MIGFQFYAVMPEARKSKSASKAYPFDPFTAKNLKAKAAADPSFRHECLGLHIENIGGRSWRHNPGAACLTIEGVLNSVGYSGVSLDYLAKRCVRIPEALARQLHPELLAYLEYEPAEVAA